MRTRSAYWTIEDARERYAVPHWGKGYFSINARGCVSVHPEKDPGSAIDLKKLVDQLKERGLHLPLLIRFTDILRHRVAELNQAFQKAIVDNAYDGDYCGVYPIKVNQQRQVVEDLVDCSKDYQFGLECGSKPELIAALALAHERDVPVICNGFKDDDFVEMVIFAQKIGKNIIPVVEKFSELELILRNAERLNVRPRFGVRVKLSAPGAGRWKLSTGARSKFGLSATELIKTMQRLKEQQMEDCLQLLHFHLGSQITNIYNLKNAITEAARIYVELTRAGAGLTYLDVGGGLGVDYDGSQTDFESSLNYSLEEYANDVVYRIKTVCDEANVRHPTVITEAGRALVAYHSVLVVNVLDVSQGFRDESQTSDLTDSESVPVAEMPPPIQNLQALYDEIAPKNLLECYHDAVQYFDEALNTFNLGYLTLAQRSLAETLYYRAIKKVLRIVRTLEHIPEELEGLEDELSETYFCNFSIFQSIPDCWAINQLFPIMPIHKLLEEPRRRGVLADITCDSDGKVDRFIGLRDVKKSLELHDFDGDEYYVGIFLVGAYQEILGDLHNLFGDTNSIHVKCNPAAGSDGVGEYDVDIEMVLKGDTVEQVLSYVQYSSQDLVSRVRRDVESALRRRTITLAEAASFVRFYEQSLTSYTYLTPRGDTDDSTATRVQEAPKYPRVIKLD
ncbi:MAG: biosynthetic arginine decarboxylase [Planctomycetes bacterium]|nr:biosynthetic arginine decarboxylase [Planctomycetota bacterium]